jgi:hypothetical protein
MLAETPRMNERSVRPGRFFLILSLKVYKKEIDATCNVTLIPAIISVPNAGGNLIMSYAIMNILGGHICKCVAAFETRDEAETVKDQYEYPFGTYIYESAEITYKVGREYKRDKTLEV